MTDVSSLKERLIDICDRQLILEIGEIEEAMDDEGFTPKDLMEAIQDVLDLKKFRDNKVNNVDL